MSESPTRSAPPLSRQHMPADYRISLDRYLGRTGTGGGYLEQETRIPADFGPRQPMRGFESCYHNIIDYIVRITHRIWEQRDVAYIGATYAGQSRVYDDYGLQLGSARIIQDTHHTTGAFSDIELIADEVIWAGDEEVGFHSSHRTLIRGTNDGDSKYGPATGNTVDVLVIANCVSLENEIFLEHVLYNNSSLLQQLGIDLEQAAEQMASAAPAGWPRAPATWDALRSAASPHRPLYLAEPVAGFDPDRFVRDHRDAVWNRRDHGVLQRHYHPDCRFEGATGRQGQGHAALADAVDDFHAPLQHLTLAVDEVYWMGNAHEGFLVSERWSGSGVHGAAGRYGEPTGAELQIWGITQYRIAAGQVVAEWMLFNELDLMMQIAAARA